MVLSQNMSLTMKERHKVIAETAGRYCASSKKGKCHIFNELTALSG